MNIQQFFKIIENYKSRIPRSSMKFKHINMNKTTAVQIKLKLFKTSNKKDFKISQRKQTYIQRHIG